jgi:hypothetical protein
MSLNPLQLRVLSVSAVQSLRLRRPRHSAAMVALSSFPARAEHFDILITLRTATGVAEGCGDTRTPEGGVRLPRQRVSAAAGETYCWSGGCGASSRTGP